MITFKKDVPELSDKFHKLKNVFNVKTACGTYAFLTEAWNKVFHVCTNRQKREIRENTFDFPTVFLIILCMETSRKLSPTLLVSNSLFPSAGVNILFLNVLNRGNFFTFNYHEGEIPFVPY